MSRNLVLGGLVAFGLLAMATTTASAQYVVRGGGHRHGGHYHGGGQYYGGRGIYPVPVVAPPRPIIVNSGYPFGSFGSPYFAPTFGSPAFVSPAPFYGYPRYGGGFNTVNFGVYRPGFGLNLGFVIR